MTAQTFACDRHILCFTLCVQFIADIASASTADELVDEVRGLREGPLVRINLCAADVADLRLCYLHLLFGAGRVLLLGKVVLAEAVVTVRAASQCLFIALVAAPRRVDRLLLMIPLHLS